MSLLKLNGNLNQDCIMGRSRYLIDNLERREEVTVEEPRGGGDFAWRAEHRMEQTGRSGGLLTAAESRVGWWMTNDRL